MNSGVFKAPEKGNKPTIIAKHKGRREFTKKLEECRVSGKQEFQLQ